MYNTIYIRMVVGSGERSGGYGAAQALRVLALMDENVGIRKQHMKWLQRQWFGGEADFSVFNRAPAAAGLFAIGVSTSRDSKFKARMETNLNKVAEKVRAYGEPGKLADQWLIEYEEGGMRYQALIKPNRAYVGAWRAADPATAATQLAGDQLLITDMTVFRDKFLEADLLLKESARGHVADAFMIIAAQDMLEIVRVRQSGMLIRTAVRNWSQFYRPGYPNAGTFMYKQDSTWFMLDSRAGYVPIGRALQIKLEAAREDLIGRDMARFEAYADRYEPAALLIEMRKIAVRTGDLSKKYADYLRVVEQRPGNAIAAEPFAETVVPRDDPDALIGDADTLHGGAGDDICYFADCGGIYEVVGGTFSERIRASVNAHMRGVDAAIAADSSLPADQIKKLHGEFDRILGALRSHVDGTLSHVKAELLMARQAARPTLLEESHRILSDWASDLAVLTGWSDALRPEDEHVTAREFRYSFIHKEEYDGRPSITMLRVKENKKPSVYLTWVQGGIQDAN